jgi:hypothetical protein
MRRFLGEMRRTVARPTWNATRSGGGRLIDLIFRNPVNFGITVGVGVLGHFLYNRFQDSYGHDGQEAYFRDLVNTKGH